MTLCDNDMLPLLNFVYKLRGPCSASAPRTLSPSKLVSGKNFLMAPKHENLIRNVNALLGSGLRQCHRVHRGGEVTLRCILVYLGTSRLVDIWAHEHVASCGRGTVCGYAHNYSADTTPPP